MRRAHRLLAIGALACWLVAPAISLAALVHVVSDHHPHQDEHRTLEWAMAATHGHSHQPAAAEHRHSALRESAPAAIPMPAPAFVEASANEVASGGAAAACWHRPLPTESPPPLFRRHCALLL